MVVMVPLRLMLPQAIKPYQGEELWEAAGHLALHCQAGLRYTLCCASLWPEVKACISEKKRKGKHRAWQPPVRFSVHVGICGQWGFMSASCSAQIG